MPKPANDDGADDDGPDSADELPGHRVIRHVGPLEALNIYTRSLHPRPGKEGGKAP